VNTTAQAFQTKRYRFLPNKYRFLPVVLKVSVKFLQNFFRMSAILLLNKYSFLPNGQRTLPTGRNGGIVFCLTVFT
jgi:hypothetical protein